jgi:1-acyl-sn-glycerol-3-phosphate acyltransferase
LPPDGQGLAAAAQARARAALAARSDLAFAFFGRVFERTLARGFHAVRIARAGPSPDPATPGLVIYSNHPSWWDGVVFVVLGRLLFPGRKVFAPIDAAMLQHYALLGRIGAFGVDQASRAGAADFLAASKLVLADPAGLLMITAQGRFADIRERPLRLAPGVAHLASLGEGATFVPLALEYTHWLEKQPEMLLRFGAPLSGATLATLPAAERRARLEGALEATMDALARDSIARDASAFDLLLEGARGVNPLYDAGRRLKAWFGGRAFNPEHGAGAP